ncbi:MAG: gamma carbonic anhydrase family protein [Neisseria sp.]|uniref:gamma carbonic anhydrase family protein n=1 Tax=Neisseria sp. TaxID=192066 RepID=UPI0026DC5CA5|nr:gamma carbonic anhydrase family protein [Neisseria sp.]MDO4248548.1 gamma carbonic anhydrase family protein [Neisseria sp.]
MPVRPYLQHFPEIASDCYIDDTAVVIGDVHIGPQSSVWPGAVLRGDVNDIRIGSGTNIQDLSMLHVSQPSDAKPEGSPLIIGNYVTIGHHVTLHGCTIGDYVLVGMGSIVLDDAVIGEEVIIGAGSLVPPRKTLASGYLYMGSPVKAVRELTEDERQHLRRSAMHYIEVADNYRHQHS